jgi:hypothetical protein
LRLDFPSNQDSAYKQESVPFFLLYHIMKFNGTSWPQLFLHRDSSLDMKVYVWGSRTILERIKIHKEPLNYCDPKFNRVQRLQSLRRKK